MKGVLPLTINVLGWSRQGVLDPNVSMIPLAILVSVSRHLSLLWMRYVQCRPSWWMMDLFPRSRARERSDCNVVDAN